LVGFAFNELNRTGKLVGCWLRYLAVEFLDYFCWDLSCGKRQVASGFAVLGGVLVMLDGVYRLFSSQWISVKTFPTTSCQ